MLSKSQGKSFAKVNRSANKIHYVIKGYEIDNPYFPSGICVTCNIRANGCSISGKPVALPDVDYDPGEVGPLLRWKKCECKICKTASSTINVKPAGKKGGRPKTSSAATPEGERPMHIIICSNCFAKIGKGLEHDCSARGKVNNIQNLLTPKSSQKFASRVISEEISANNSANDATRPALSTFDKKKPFLVKDTCKKQIKVSVDDISNMQVDVGLSTKQTLKIAEQLRSKPIGDNKGNIQTNRSVVESNLRTKLREKNRQVDCLFEVRNQNFVNIDEKRRHAKTSTVTLLFVMIWMNWLVELSKKEIWRREIFFSALVWTVVVAF